jgi:hypothetical protein
MIGGFTEYTHFWKKYSLKINFEWVVNWMEVTLEDVEKEEKK